jgi:hypothetical protein
MSDVVFCCPHCQHILLVDAAGIGMEVPCPKCEAKIAIPSTAMPRHLLLQLALEPEQEQVDDVAVPAEPESAAAGSAPEPERTGRPPRTILDSTTGSALIAPPSRRNLFGGLILLALVTVILMLALFVQARLGFTPPEADSPRAASVRPLARAELGKPVSLGPVALNFLGVRTWPQHNGAMVFQVRLRNNGREPLQLAYLWGDTVLWLDRLAHRPFLMVEPSVPAELGPGQEMEMGLLFPRVPLTGVNLSVVSYPGVWTKTATGAFVPATAGGVELSFRRGDAVIAKAADLEDAFPSLPAN